ncbi:DNA cytosine methyltransferase [Streptomyces sp. NPDC088261]|uniref:DNA cytosine methyltransferase n=1 Tax=Streptomyces sp. NPDC088261 TaxID=3365851 RepID=UPI0038236ED0
MSTPIHYKSQNVPIGVIDLFAGCGGLSAGFRSYEPNGPGSSPFTSVAAVEFDKAAASTYAANFGSVHVHADDIATFDPAPFERTTDVIVGGPPCQGFSGLGKNDPNDPRNELWREYMRVVTTVRPKIFVIENVDRFLKSSQFAELEAAVDKPDGELNDYWMEVKILNSADYGVPQARRRVIVICTHRDLGIPLRHPTPTHDRNGILPDPGAEKQAAFFTTDQLSEVNLPPLPWVPVGPQVFDRSDEVPLLGPDLPSPSGDPSPFDANILGHYLTTDLHIRRTTTELSRARYLAIPPGGNRMNLREMRYRLDGTGRIRLSTEDGYNRLRGPEYNLSTDSWDRHDTGAGDVMGRLRPGGPSVTIRTEFFKPEKGRYLHPTANRPITHFEAALIQGFPENFKWYGSKTQIARQIGNAVPVGLGRALAQAIHEHLEMYGRPAHP